MLDSAPRTVGPRLFVSLTSVAEPNDAIRVEGAEEDLDWLLAQVPPGILEAGPRERSVHGVARDLWGAGSETLAEVLAVLRRAADVACVDLRIAPALVVAARAHEESVASPPAVSGPSVLSTCGYCGEGVPIAMHGPGSRAACALCLDAFRQAGTEALVRAFAESFAAVAS
jgi:hypothetical protein